MEIRNLRNKLQELKQDEFCIALFCIALFLKFFKKLNILETEDRLQYVEYGYKSCLTHNLKLKNMESVQYKKSYENFSPQFWSTRNSGVYLFKTL